MKTKAVGKDATISKAEGVKTPKTNLYKKLTSETTAIIMAMRFGVKCFLTFETLAVTTFVDFFAINLFYINLLFK